MDRYETLSIILFVLFVYGSIVTPFVIDRATRHRAVLRLVLPALGLLCVAGLAYGAHCWYQRLGRIHETHTVEEYRFQITSLRDPEFADDGEVGEDVHISVLHRGTPVVDSLYIGGLWDKATPPTFSVRRLPNDSLLIVTRNDREAQVVFAYDTATGETWPLNPRTTTEEYAARARFWEKRVRAALGDERYELRGFLGY